MVDMKLGREPLASSLARANSYFGKLGAKRCHQQRPPMNVGWCSHKVRRKLVNWTHEVEPSRADDAIIYIPVPPAVACKPLKNKTDCVKLVLVRSTGVGTLMLRGLEQDW
ncbi:hypothetical protein CBL_04588 [Carabus blaptoides fortunei]